MALFIKATGETRKIEPQNRRDFKLEELYALLDCRCIDTIALSDGQVMIIDDEGKFKEEHDVNVTATLLFREGRMNYHQLRDYMKELEEKGTIVIDARDVAGDDYIAGDVLVCQGDEFL